MFCGGGGGGGGLNYEYIMSGRGTVRLGAREKNLPRARGGPVELVLFLDLVSCTHPSASSGALHFVPRMRWFFLGGKSSIKSGLSVAFFFPPL